MLVSFDNLRTSGVFLLIKNRSSRMIFYKKIVSRDSWFHPASLELRRTRADGRRRILAMSVCSKAFFSKPLVLSLSKDTSEIKNYRTTKLIKRFGTKIILTISFPSSHCVINAFASFSASLCVMPFSV